MLSNSKIKIKKQCLYRLRFSAVSLLLCLLLCIGSTSCKKHTQADNSSIDDESRNLEEAETVLSVETTAEMKNAETEDTAPEAAVTTKAEETTQAKAVIPVDFVSLQKQNPDIYAWITIPDTGIDFPIVQSSSSDIFYLRHDINGNYDIAGSIFTQPSYNSKDFTDFDTIIYGHNMGTGVMFEPLMNYLDHDYFDAHREITIYTVDHILTYKIFAAFTWDDRHILYTYDFSKEAIRAGFIEYVCSIRDINSSIDTEMDLGPNDKYVTLSTCTFTKGQRLLVMGVLTDEK